MKQVDYITSQIIQGAYAVHRYFGPGFLEKIYENALRIACEERGLQVQQQSPVAVRYHDHLVGEHAMDLLVNNSVIVELKAVRRDDPVHEAQLLHYLRATSIHAGLLINFGMERLSVRRRLL